MTTTRTPSSQEHAPQPEPGSGEARGGGACPLCAFNRMLRIENLIGEEAARHLRRSQKEVLLAVRSAIDAAIDSLEARSEARRAEKIEVS